MKKTFSYSYEEYLSHQIEKKDAKLDYAISRINVDYKIFCLRFSTYQKYIRGEKIICLGARLGTEVRALRDLGYGKAFGVDIGEYTSDSDLVVYGDFNKLDYPDSSFDFSYCNTLDHVYDLNAFFKEQMRIMRPGSYSLFDFQGDYKSEKFGQYIDQPESFRSVENLIDSMGNTVVSSTNINLPWKGKSILVRWGKWPKNDGGLSSSEMVKFVLNEMLLRLMIKTRILK